MVAVFTVENDPRVRSAVRTMLEARADYTLTGEAASVAAAIDLVPRARPDVLLLDLGLPDGSGSLVLRAVRAAGLEPLALVLTVHQDDEHVFDALRAGAAGYLLKDELSRLVSALDEARAGGAPMSPLIARRVLASFAESKRQATSAQAVAFPVLTPREREVTEQLADGASYDEIGRALGISTNTVRTFIRSIYEKLHVCSKTEAVKEAMRLGYLRPPR